MPLIYKDGVSIFFFHIPKCAGTSVEKIFVKNNYSMDLHNPSHAYKPLSKHFKCSPQHYHYDMVKSIVDISSFDYCFSITRDPVERIISEYKMRSKHHASPPSFAVWLERIITIYNKNSFVLDNHVRPQYEFVGPEVKVYNLSAGLASIFEEIQSDLGVEIKEADHFHASHGSENFGAGINRNTLSKDELDMISSLYSTDMELFK